MSASAQVAPAGGAGQEPVTLKVMTQHVVTDVALYIAQERGYFKEQDLNIQFRDISNGSDAVPFVSTGKLDVAVGSPGAGLFNAMARGINVKLVADKGAVSPDGKNKNGFTGLQWLVVAKSEADSIKRYQDLKGKTVAIPDRGAGLEIMLDKLLAKGGLTLNDVNIKTVPFPSMLAALGNKSIDAALELEPFATQGAAKGSLVRFKNAVDFYPGEQAAALVFGPSVDRMGHNVGTRFMVAYTKGLRAYNDAFGPKKKDHAAVVSILVKNIAVKDPALYDEMSWSYMNPNCTLNSKVLAEDLDWYVAHGYVKVKPDLSKAIDDSYCAAAVNQLGPYAY